MSGTMDFPRAESEVISSGALLAALPVPRSSSEIVAPSAEFLNLMLLPEQVKKREPNTVHAPVPEMEPLHGSALPTPPMPVAAPPVQEAPGPALAPAPAPAPVPIKPAQTLAPSSQPWGPAAQPMQASTAFMRPGDAQQAAMQAATTIPGPSQLGGQLRGLDEAKEVSRPSLLDGGLSNGLPGSSAPGQQTHWLAGGSDVGALASAAAPPPRPAQPVNTSTVAPSCMPQSQPHTFAGGFPAGGHKPMAPASSASTYGLQPAAAVNTARPQLGIGGMATSGAFPWPSSGPGGLDGTYHSKTTPVAGSGFLGAPSLAALGGLRQSANPPQPMAVPAQRGRSPCSHTQSSMAVAPQQAMQPQPGPLQPGSLRLGASQLGAAQGSTSQLSATMMGQGMLSYQGASAVHPQSVGQLSMQRAAPRPQAASWTPGPSGGDAGGLAAQRPWLAAAPQPQQPRHQAIAAPPQAPLPAQFQRVPLPPGSFAPARASVPSQLGPQQPGLQSVGAASPLAPAGPSPMASPMAGYPPYKQHMPPGALTLPVGQLRF